MKKTTRIRHVIWDWNGTLLDDLDAVIGSLNQMLKRRELKQVTRDEYRDQFGFPVIRYYQAVGFDFGHESYDEVAREYIDAYEARCPACRLHEGAREVLWELGRRGIRQTVLTAAEQGHIRDELSRRRLLESFSDVVGTDNILGHGKLACGQAWFAGAGICPEQALLIGDTVHDFEVASRLGIHCLLYTQGHQSPWRLAATGAARIASLSGIPGMLG